MTISRILESFLEEEKEKEVKRLEEKLLRW